MAPKPVTLIGKYGDFFDARGTEEAYARLKRLYTLLGAPDKIGLFLSPGPHGYAQDSREAMYRWFNRFTGVSTAKTEPALVLEKDEDLYATPHGQVAELRGARSVFAETKAAAEALGRKRSRLTGAALTKAVTTALRLVPPAAGERAPDFRILRSMGGRGYPKRSAAIYAVETEPGIQAIVYRLDDESVLSQPPRGGKRAVLYVSDRSSDRELREEPFLAELARAEADAVFFTCDVRGIGESQPDTCGRDMFDKPYGSDYFYAGHSLMMDRPYAGQRTHDVLRVLAWLSSYGHDDVHLVARGWGTIPATFAALLAPTVTKVTLKGALPSYTSVATTELYTWPLASFVPGVLRTFDLPDCYKALAAKKLRMIAAAV
jgi:hypothetical protein